MRASDSVPLPSSNQSTNLRRTCIFLPLFSLSEKPRLLLWTSSYSYPFCPIIIRSTSPCPRPPPLPHPIVVISQYISEDPLAPLSPKYDLSSAILSGPCCRTKCTRTDYTTLIADASPRVLLSRVVRFADWMYIVQAVCSDFPIFNPKDSKPRESHG